MSKTIFVIVGLLVLAAAGYGLLATRSQRTDGEQAASEPRGQSAPDFSLRDYDGNVVTLAQFRGKPVVVNSWAAWCPFCRNELPDFAAVQREFNERVTIIAIDRAESRETAKRYSDDLDVSDDLVFLLDPEDSFYRSIGGFSMPETILVNSQGEIVFHKRGPMTQDELRRRIAEAFGI